MLIVEQSIYTTQTMIKVGSVSIYARFLLIYRHRNKSRSVKLAIRNAEKYVRKTLETFNRYVWRKDVLCVHVHIGGLNWAYYNKSGAISQSDAFIEKVDDSFDSTYCGIYLRINPELARAYIAGSRE